MKKIPLTRGLFAKVDDKDFEHLSKFKWYAQSRSDGKQFYAARVINAKQINKKKAGKKKMVRMHREIMKTPKGLFVDHINGDELDNRRKNLRNCTMMKNTWNQKKKITNKSGFKGVHWRKDIKKWAAQVSGNKGKRHLGFFEDIKEAALAYDVAAKKQHLEFAKTNF